MDADDTTDEQLRDNMSGKVQVTYKGVQEIEKVRIDLDPDRKSEMMSRTGLRTVPQIYIGETHVGGCDDLHALEQRGGLDPLLAGA